MSAVAVVLNRYDALYLHNGVIGLGGCLFGRVILSNNMVYVNGMEGFYWIFEKCNSKLLFIWEILKFLCCRSIYQEENIRKYF